MLREIAVKGQQTTDGRKMPERTDYYFRRRHEKVAKLLSSGSFGEVCVLSLKLRGR